MILQGLMHLSLLVTRETRVATLLAKIMLAKHPFTFTELAFSGLFRETENYNQVINCFSYKLVFMDYFTAIKHAFSRFRFIRSSLYCKFFRVMFYFVLTGVD